MRYLGGSGDCSLFSHKHVVLKYHALFSDAMKMKARYFCIASLCRSRHGVLCCFAEMRGDEER
jgi:hypothetical protein